MRPLAVVGNLSLDRVDGGEPRAGGAPFHAARALRVLGRPAIVAAKGAEADRRLLLAPLVRLGLPVLWRGGDSTAAFSFHYSGDLRSMVVDALGPQWTAADRSLVDTDVVCWYTFGVTHFVRPEDWPVMPVEYTGFLLSPVGFFDQNPALDVPASSNGHCD